jgi:hypothetical protein
MGGLERLGEFTAGQAVAARAELLHRAEGEIGSFCEFETHS